ALAGKGHIQERVPSRIRRLARITPELTTRASVLQPRDVARETEQPCSSASFSAASVGPKSAYRSRTIDREGPNLGWKPVIAGRHRRRHQGQARAKSGRISILSRSVSGRVVRLGAVSDPLSRHPFEISITEILVGFGGLQRVGPALVPAWMAPGREMFLYGATPKPALAPAWMAPGRGPTCTRPTCTPALAPVWMAPG